MLSESIDPHLFWELRYNKVVHNKTNTDNLNQSMLVQIYRIVESLSLFSINDENF